MAELYLVTDFGPRPEHPEFVNAVWVKADSWEEAAEQGRDALITQEGSEERGYCETVHVMYGVRRVFEFEARAVRVPPSDASS